MRASPVMLILAALLGLAELLPPGSADAFSPLGSATFGEPLVSADARSRAMGGTGIALADSLGYSLLNPAAVAAVRRMVFSGTVEMQYLSVTDERSTGAYGSVYVPYLFWGLAAPHGVKLAFSFSQESRLDSRSVSSGLLEGRAFEQSLQYSGGINLLSGVLGYRLSEGVLAGINIGFLVGSFREDRTVDFGAGFEDSRESIRLTHPAEMILRLGILRRSERVATGLFVELPSKLELTWTRTSNLSSELSRRGSLSIPASFGAGAARVFDGRYLVCADLHVQPWSGAEWTGPEWVRLRNGSRVALGIERMGSPREGGPSIPCSRAGYSYRRWSWSDALGNPVSEHTVSLGLDFVPGPGARGRIAVALEFGTRGSLHTNGLSEKFVRLSMSALAGEKWSRVKRRLP